MQQIRFAFVGFGSIAKTHIIALKALPVIKHLTYIPVLDTLVSRWPETNQSQAESIGFEYVTDSLEDALQRRKIDIVNICTPNALHPSGVELSAYYRKAIYCEKPLSDSVENSRCLTTKVQNDLKHQVALVFRYHPAVKRIKAALREGKIGKVLQCNISYRKSKFLDAKRPVNWRLSDQLSGKGGAIIDLGVHVLDLYRHLFGEIDGVEGRTEIFVKQRPLLTNSSTLVDMTLDDWAEMQITMLTGVKGTAEVSRIAWGSETFHLQIIGTEGSIMCDLERDILPTIKLLDGSSPQITDPSSLSLLPDERLSLGIFQDCHFGSLYHFLQRFQGEDEFTGLAPCFQDSLIAEEWIHKVIGMNQ